MFSCREAIQQLWDYVDRATPFRRIEEIAVHLAECVRGDARYRSDFASVPLVSSRLVERIRELGGA